MSEVTPFFADGGHLAKVKKGFHQREGQSQLAALILDCIENQQHLIAEAPTGFGKSLTALVPAGIAAEEGKRIIISTGTLTLQDQYIYNDLPTIKRACEEAGIGGWNYAVAKGRNNYICRNKVDAIVQERQGLTPIALWAAKQSHPRDKGDIAFADVDWSNLEWRAVGADEFCEMKACPYYGKGKKGPTECFVYEAQCTYTGASIVVVNHTLMLLDAMTENKILGPYDVLIVDEAHELPEKAQSVWGFELKPRSCSSTIRLIDRMLTKVGHGTAVTTDLLMNVQRTEEDIFDPFKPALPRGSMPMKAVKPHIIEESKNAANRMIDLLADFNSDLTNLQSDDSVVSSCKDKISKLLTVLRNVYGDKVDSDYAENWLTFVEAATNSKREKYAILHLKPIDVAPLMKAYLLDIIPTCVFMSATMQINRSFTFMKKEFGLPKETREFIGSSPFNFQENVVGYFPKHNAKKPGRDESPDQYLQDLEDEIVKCIEHTNGSALILFTNSSHMNELHPRVKRRVSQRVMIQGEASKPALIQAMMDDHSSCLFATKSFFTGVDLPGDALRFVILVSCPFRVPSDPLFAAKCDRIDRAGGSSFSSYSMPLMLFDFLQAFGRLVRTVDDSGFFALLDSKANTSGYGQKLKDVLPKFPKRSELTH